MDVAAGRWRQGARSSPTTQCWRLSSCLLKDVEVDEHRRPHDALMTRSKGQVVSKHVYMFTPSAPYLMWFFLVRHCQMEWRANYRKGSFSSLHVRLWNMKYGRMSSSYLTPVILVLDSALCSGPIYWSEAFRLLPLWTSSWGTARRT